MCSLDLRLSSLCSELERQRERQYENASFLFLPLSLGFTDSDRSISISIYFSCPLVAKVLRPQEGGHRSNGLRRESMHSAQKTV